MKKWWMAVVAGLVASGCAWGAELLGRVEIRGIETWLDEVEAASRGTPLAGSVPMWPALLESALGWDAFELLDGAGLVAVEAWGDVGARDVTGIGVGLELPAKDAAALQEAFGNAWTAAEDGASWRAGNAVVLAEAAGDGRVWVGVSDEPEAARTALDGIRGGGEERRLAAGGTLAAGWPDIGVLALGMEIAERGGKFRSAWAPLLSGLREVSYGVGLGGGVGRIEEAVGFTDGGAARWGLGGQSALGSSEPVYAVNLEGALGVMAFKGGSSLALRDVFKIQQENWEKLGSEFGKGAPVDLAEKFGQIGRFFEAAIDRVGEADMGVAWLPGGEASRVPGAAVIVEGAKGVGEIRDWVRAHAETALGDLARWAGLDNADALPVAIEWRGERQGPGGEGVDRYAVLLADHECWKGLARDGTEFPLEVSDVELAWAEPGRMVATTAGSEAMDEILRRAADGTGRDPRAEPGCAALCGGEDGDCVAAGWVKGFELWRRQFAAVSDWVARCGDDGVAGVFDSELFARVVPESDGLVAFRTRMDGELDWRAQIAFGLAEWRRFAMNAYNEGVRMAERAMGEALRAGAAE